MGTHESRKSGRQNDVRTQFRDKPTGRIQIWLGDAISGRKFRFGTRYWDKTNSLALSPATDTRAPFQQLCLFQPQPYPNPEINPNLSCVQSTACALFWDTMSDLFPSTFIPHPVLFWLVLRHFLSGALHCLLCSFTPLVLLFPCTKNAFPFCFGGSTISL